MPSRPIQGFPPAIFFAIASRMGLEIRNLDCARGQRRLLSGVDFSVPDGRVLVLTGPNGAGKTTLLKTIAGLIPAAGGEIVAPPESMVYVGHENGLKSQLSVAENLRFWQKIFQCGDVDETLETFELSDLSNRRAQHLSAGQKRRLGLARVFLCNRSIWLLDEPAVSLDAASRTMLTAVIDRHTGMGGIAVIVSHDALGPERADRLDVGRFRAVATARTDAFLQAFAS